MESNSRKVEFFALSTCGWCRKTRDWLDENRVAYDMVYMDQTSGDEREAARQRMMEFVSRLSFPLLIIDNGAEVIQGYKPDRFEECLK
jgi:glutaredoxin